MVSVTDHQNVVRETIDHRVAPVVDTSARHDTSASFDDFYAREFQSLVALARALSGSVEHAEDIAQEVMLKAFRRWGEVQHLDKPGAWVRRVCANQATSLFRRRLVEARALIRLRPHAGGVMDAESASEGAFWSEVRRLPRRQAQVVALYYLYGCSVRETANVLDCAEGTVKVHLSRARATLAVRLGSEGGGRSS